jgi:NTP pyrophosphatase (non-canonical NTP hydrolase)
MDELIEKLRAFRDARQWQQFHNSKDLAIALNVESAELLETFLWKSAEAADKDRIADELADVFSYALLLADACQLDVRDIVLAKIARNESRYPVDLARGSARKYTEL